MSDDFDKVKESLKIEDYLRNKGHELNKNGFCQPAFCCGSSDCCKVDRNKNLFHCFSCDSGGSVIDAIMMLEEVKEQEALKIGARLAGVELTAGGEPIRKKKESLKDKMYREAAEYYHSVFMKKDSAGRKYFIEKRGHLESTAEHLLLGEVDGHLIKHLEKKGFKIGDIISNGLAKTENSEGKAYKSPVDYFLKGHLIVPVIDHNGFVVAFTTKDPQKKMNGMMLKGQKKDWFINHKALGSPDLIVVEGENDLASLIDIGFKNVVGTAGQPGHEQVLKLKNFQKGKRVILWFDDDPNEDYTKPKGGPAHTRFILNRLKDSDITINVVDQIKPFKDPDEYIQAIMKDMEAVKREKTEEMQMTA